MTNRASSLLLTLLLAVPSAAQPQQESQDVESSSPTLKIGAYAEPNFDGIFQREDIAAFLATLDEPSSPSLGLKGPPLEASGHQDRLRELPRLAGRAGKHIISDTRSVLTTPRRMDKGDWMTAAKIGLVVGGAMQLDKAVRDKAKDDSNLTWKFFTDLGGNKYTLPLMATTFAAGVADYVLTGDTHLRDATFTTAESALVAGLVTAGLKIAVGRSRPNKEQGPHHYKPFAGGKSFPSGHAASAFAMAASISEYYDGLVPPAAYTVASLISISRLNQDAHFLSDIAAGAAIGWLVGKHLSRRHLEGSGWNVAPLLSEEGVGVAVVRTF